MTRVQALEMILDLAAQNFIDDNDEEMSHELDRQELAYVIVAKMLEKLAKRTGYVYDKKKNCYVKEKTEVAEETKLPPPLIPPPSSRLAGTYYNSFEPDADGFADATDCFGS